MIESLFVGDGDELAFTSNVERVFQIKLTEADYDCHDMGDVEEVVLRHLSEKTSAQNRCMSALAFYEIRRALSAEGSIISPSTPIKELALNPRQLAFTIKRRTGLSWAFHLGSVGGAGMLLVLAGLIMFFGGALVLRPPVLGPAGGVLLFALGLMTVRLDPGSFGSMQNSGDIARELGNQNFGRFAARGARYTPEDVWRRLQELAVDEPGGSPDDVTRDTLLMHPRKNWFGVFG